MQLICLKRMEEEFKLAQQFSERLKLDVNNLSKFIFEKPEETIENEFPGRFRSF